MRNKDAPECYFSMRCRISCAHHSHLKNFSKCEICREHKTNDNARKGCNWPRRLPDKHGKHGAECDKLATKQENRATEELKPQDGLNKAQIAQEVRSDVQRVLVMPKIYWTTPCAHRHEFSGRETFDAQGSRYIHEHAAEQPIIEDEVTRHVRETI